MKPYHRATNVIALRGNTGREFPTLSAASEIMVYTMVPVIHLPIGPSASFHSATVKVDCDVQLVRPLAQECSVVMKPLRVCAVLSWYSSASIVREPFPGASRVLQGAFTKTETEERSVVLNATEAQLLDTAQSGSSRRLRILCLLRRSGHDHASLYPRRVLWEPVAVGVGAYVVQDTNVVTVYPWCGEIAPRTYVRRGEEREGFADVVLRGEQTGDVLDMHTLESLSWAESPNTVPMRVAIITGKRSRLDEDGW